MPVSKLLEHSHGGIEAYRSFCSQSARKGSLSGFLVLTKQVLVTITACQTAINLQPLYLCWIRYSAIPNIAFRLRTLNPVLRCICSTQRLVNLHSGRASEPLFRPGVY